MSKVLISKNATRKMTEAEHRRLERMKDSEIDVSDIPPLTEEDFRRAIPHRVVVAKRLQPDDPLVRQGYYSSLRAAEQRPVVEKFGRKRPAHAHLIEVSVHLEPDIATWVRKLGSRRFNLLLRSVKEEVC
jgi:hypothetical protein